MPRTGSFNLLAFATMFYLSILVAGCSSTPSAALLEAERMMEQSPDSASAVIESINPDSLGRSADKALYNLLITQSLYKNYLPLPADSVIQFAVNYYKGSGDDARLMRALYYKGVVDREHGDYESAIPSALHAEELARRLDSPLWIARTNELLSDIFYDNYNWEESMKHTEVAIKNYSETGKKINEYYSKLHKASLYSDLNEMHRSLEVCDSILSMREEWDNDTVLWAHTIDVSYYPLIVLGQFERAVEYVAIRSRLAVPVSSRTLIMWSYIYEHFGDLKKAKICLEASESVALNESDRLIVWLRIKELYADSSDFKKALMYSDSILDYYNRAVRDISVQTAYQIKNSYTETKLDKEHIEKLKIKYISLIISLSLVLFIAAMLIWNRNMARRRKLEAEENMIAISELTVRLFNEQSENKKLQDSANRLYSEHFDTINILCQEFFEGDSTDKDKLRIYKRAESEISKLRTADRLNVMIEFVDRNKDGRLSELFEEIPLLTDDEKRMITFICAGLSSKAISLIMGMKYKTFHTVKRRLKERLAGLEISETVKVWLLDSMTFRK